VYFWLLWIGAVAKKREYGFIIYEMNRAKNMTPVNSAKYGSSTSVPRNQDRPDSYASAFDLTHVCLLTAM
jgi:hypothetical protein